MVVEVVVVAHRMLKCLGVVDFGVDLARVREVFEVFRVACDGWIFVGEHVAPDRIE